jgi:hypothetical protein
MCSDPTTRFDDDERKDLGVYSNKLGKVRLGKE